MEPVPEERERDAQSESLGGRDGIRIRRRCLFGEKIVRMIENQRRLMML